MKKISVNEKINVAITVFSLLVSCGLISNMLLYKPSSMLQNGEQIEEKQTKLNEVNVMENKDEATLLTQEYIASVIGGYLPDFIPKNNIKVNINSNGYVYLSAIASRNQLENMLNGYIGFKEKMFLMMLPRQFEIGIGLKGNFDSESSMIMFMPTGLNVGGMSIDSSILPGNISEVISQGFNQALIDSNFYYTKASFKNGGIELIP